MVSVSRPDVPEAHLPFLVQDHACFKPVGFLDIGYVPGPSLGAGTVPVPRCLLSSGKDEEAPGEGIWTTKTTELFGNCVT